MKLITKIGYYYGSYGNLTSITDRYYILFYGDVLNNINCAQHEVTGLCSSMGGNSIGDANILSTAQTSNSGCLGGYAYGGQTAIGSSCKADSDYIYLLGSHRLQENSTNDTTNVLGVSSYTVTDNKTFDASGQTFKEITYKVTLSGGTGISISFKGVYHSNVHSTVSRGSNRTFQTVSSATSGSSLTLHLKFGPLYYFTVSATGSDGDGYSYYRNDSYTSYSTFYIGSSWGEMRLW